MKKIYLLLSLLAALSAISTKLAAQDPNYSQFFFKESYYNPAFIGINPGLRGVATNRQMWTNVPGLHQASHVSIDYYDVKLLNGGLSAFANNYMKGDFIRVTSGGLGYAKRIGITRDFIMQLGGTANYTMFNYDFTNLTFSDELDPVHGPIYQSEFDKNTLENRRGFFDFSAGVVARFNIKTTPINTLATNTFGAAMHHITEPETSMLKDGKNKLPTKINLHAYSVIKVARGNFYNSHFLIAPGVLFENQTLRENLFNGKDETSAKTMTYGFNAIIPSRTAFMSSLYTGLWMRHQFYKKKTIGADLKEGFFKKNYDSMIATLGYIKYSRDGKSLYRVVYSYDLTMSSAGFGTGGSHELTLAFEIHDLALPGKPRKWGYVKNPADRFYHLK
jgi:type IX secretion system PorP/SprF family membrane protein